MSRRTRYGRAQHTTARGPRGDAARTEANRARPVGPGKAPAAAQAAPTNGHVADVAPTRFDVARDVPGVGQTQPAPATIATASATSAASAAAAAPLAGPVETLVAAGLVAGLGPNGTHVPQAAEPAGCTAPQLRRFIKSRTYVPMHELRRRFGINGGEDDVTLVEMDGRRIFVGLPTREGRLLGELLRGGDVGYQLSLDPLSPIVVGVYPMRPVPRT